MRNKSKSEIEPKFIFEFYCRSIWRWLFLFFFPSFVCYRHRHRVSLPSTCCCLFKLLVSATHTRTHRHSTVAFGVRIFWGIYSFDSSYSMKGLTFIWHCIYCRMHWQRAMWVTQFWRNCHFDFIILLKFQWQIQIEFCARWEEMIWCCLRLVCNIRQRFGHSNMMCWIIWLNACVNRI